ncbi:MAG: iron-sulfur cluster assembly scaffold protein [Alphaproteobacteria bacterium]|nr:iron-sulfur cluster assembly scaffold protein [Alphaproteobacteria bacterium]MBV9542252.1 iron-sulfur cluster assembly scaffold protein [Alphaproteobacteria bacterium]MBV9903141.1 iron-sulfur cluster assembly scaffold protein [Alphaproteobacteria bacterium]
MSDPLYKKELLRLAADATGAGRLAVPCGTGVAHNPACGDKVTVDVALEGGRIAAVAHHTRACVLTQASASIVGGQLAGLNRAEVVSLHNAIAVMLQGGETPLAPLDSFRVFDGVADHPARHKCVLLPLEAVIAALDSEGCEPAG